MGAGRHGRIRVGRCAEREQGSRIFARAELRGLAAERWVLHARATSGVSAGRVAAASCFRPTPAGWWALSAYQICGTNYDSRLPLARRQQAGLGRGSLQGGLRGACRRLARIARRDLNYLSGSAASWSEIEIAARPPGLAGVRACLTMGPELRGLAAERFL